MTRGQSFGLRGRLRGAALLAAAFVVIGAPIFAHAAGPDPSGLLGYWINEPKKVVIDIYPCEDRLCAKIVWLARPYRRDGKIKRDDRNPDAALQNRPYCGLEMIWGLKGKSDRAWVRGQLYYPKRGETYDVDIKLKHADRLVLRAYIGVKLLGRSENWSRPEPDRTIACPLQP